MFIFARSLTLKIDRKMKEKLNFKPYPIVFRRWINKGYAVFNSLNKVIAIACLMVAYLLFASPEEVKAQQKDSTVAKSYDLESIDITSEELPETYSAMSRVVVTITKNEIEQASVSSVNELLEYASNIDIRQRGTNGAQADISIRGGSFDQVLVLLNGVNISDPQTGHHNLNLPVSISSIERIEILKGPGAWKFGPGAFSGAINIITKAPEKNELNLEASAGQFKLNEQKVGLGMQVKNTSHLLSASRESSGGYVSNTDYTINNLYYHGMLKAGSNEISLQGGATSKAFGANSFYTAKYPDQYEETQTYFGAVSYKTAFHNIVIEPRLYYRRNNDRFVLFRQNPASWYTRDNFHTSNVYGANVIASIMHGTRGMTTLGIDERVESIYSTNLGEITENVMISPMNDSITLDHAHSRSNFSMVLSHKHYFNKLALNVGLNLSKNSDISDKVFLFPGVDLNYAIDDASSVLASANKTMRMPTYTDLFYQGPSNQGNPDLLPEEALGLELGYKYVSKFATASLTGFYMQGKNLIDWVRQAEESVWTTMNHAELNTAGIEAQFKMNLNEVFDHQDILKQVKVSYTFIDQSKIETELVSNYSLNYLKHRVDVSLNHKIWKDIQASWHYAFQDRNGQYEKIVDKTSQGLTDYEPFSTIDAKLFWNHSGWTIYASLNNLFNVSYYDIGNVPQPGRWVKFGIVKQLDL